jgi:hypothetical protein
MIPQIKFQYSRIYDFAFYHFSTGKNKELNDNLFLSRESFCLRKIKLIEKWWNLNGSDILMKIQKYSGLKWTQKEINIYFLAEPHRKTWMGGFSNPITIFLKKIINGKVLNEDLIFVKTAVIHELVHHNIPLKQIEKLIDELQAKFSCDRIAATHIIIHAVLDKIFSKKELIYNKHSCKSHKSYQLAWKILEKETSDKIIDIFKKYIYKNPSPFKS